MIYTWDSAFEAAPADIDDISDGAGEIREFKIAVRERFATDHYIDLTGTNADHGEHSKVTLRKQTSKPTAEADKGYIYTKIVSDKVELFYENEEGTEIQLTVGGALPIAFPAGLTTNSKTVLYENGSALQDIGMNSDASAHEWFNGPRALLTGIGDLLYSSAANTLARLAIGTAGQSLRVNSGATGYEFSNNIAIESFTKDGTVSANVSYTGAGFTPAVVIMIAGYNYNSRHCHSLGITDGTNLFCISSSDWEGSYWSSDYLGYFRWDTHYQRVTFSSFDAHGVTLVWTETGTFPATLTGVLIYLR